MHKRRKVLNIGGGAGGGRGGGGGRCGGKVQNIGGQGGGANFSMAVNRSEPLPPISAK